MILTINRTGSEGDFMGFSWEYNGFSGGLVAGRKGLTTEQMSRGKTNKQYYTRLYFSADTESECKAMAQAYCDSLGAGISRTKLQNEINKL